MNQLTLFFLKILLFIPVSDERVEVLSPGSEKVSEFPILEDALQFVTDNKEIEGNFSLSLKSGSRFPIKRNWRFGIGTNLIIRSAEDRVSTIAFDFSEAGEISMFTEGILSVTDVNFEIPHTRFSGSFIYLSGPLASLILERVQFQSAPTASAHAGSEGNSLFFLNNAGSLQLRSALFSNFTCKNFGIIYGSKVGVAELSNVTFWRATVENCLLFSLAECDIKFSELAISSSVFQDSAAIFVRDSSRLLLESLIFTNCSVISNRSVVLIDNSLLRISTLLVSSNSLNSSRDFLCVSNHSSLVETRQIGFMLNKCPVNSNTLLLNISTPNKNGSLIAISQLFFDSNENLSGGISIESKKAEVRVEDFSCRKNSFKAGSCLKCNSAWETLFRGVIFSENNAINSPAGLNLLNPMLRVEIENCVFLGNSAFFNKASFGCSLNIVSAHSVNVSIRAGSFLSNQVESFSKGGGAIFFSSFNSSLVIELGSFIANEASGFANAIEFEGSSVDMISTLFEGNRKLDGFSLNSTSTGVMIGKVGFVRFLNVSIRKNVGFLGNFLFFEREFLQVFFQNGSIEGNSAAFGTFLYIFGGNQRTNVSIKYLIFTQNHARYFGLVVYRYAPIKIIYNDIYVEGSIFKDNMLSDDGLFSVWIHSGDSNTSISNCLFGRLFLELLDWAAPPFSFIGIYKVIFLTISNCIIKDLYENSPFKLAVIFLLKCKAHIYNTYLDPSITLFSMSVFGIDQNSTLIFENCILFNTESYAFALGISRESDLIFNRSKIVSMRSKISIILIVSNAGFQIFNSTFAQASLPKGELFDIIGGADIVYKIELSAFININSTLFSGENSALFFKNCQFLNLSKNLFLLNSDSKIRITGSSFVDIESTDSDHFTYDAIVLSATLSMIEISHTSFENFFLKAASKLFFLSQASFSITYSNFRNFYVDREETASKSLYFSSLQTNLSLESIHFENISFSVVNASFSKLIMDNVSVIQPEPALSLDLSASCCSLINCPEILIFRSIFLNLRFRNAQGGCLSLVNNSLEGLSSRPAKILNNSFSRNHLLTGSGAAALLADFSAEFVGNHFSGNKAENGGAIYILFSNTSASAQVIEIRNNTFSMNWAEKAGGAIFWINQSPDIHDSNVFFSNKALKYGDSVASPPLRMIIQIEGKRSEPNSKLYIDGLKPGIDLKVPVWVFFADAYLQSVPLDDRMWCDLKLFDQKLNISLQGRLIGEQDFTKNAFKFSNFSILSNTSELPVFFVFYSSSLSRMSEITFNTLSSKHKNEAYIDKQYYLILEANLTECSLGEVFIKGACRLCPKGTYSFSTEDSLCKPCLKGTVCLGGALVKVLPGFWRSHQFSENLYKCTKGLNSCAGGDLNLCEKNFQGRKCQTCFSSNQTLYLNSLWGQCLSCPEAPLLSLLFLAEALISTGALVFLTVCFENEKMLNSTKVCVKVAINYFHLLILIQSNDFSASPLVRQYLSYTGAILRRGSILLLTECFLAGRIHHQLFVLEIFYLVLPGLAYLFYKLMKVKLRRSRIELKLIARTSFFFVFIYVFAPLFMDSMIANLICETIDGEAVIKSSPGSTCFDAEYLLWMGCFYIPNFIFFGLGTPYIAFKYKFVNNKVALSFGHLISTKNLPEPTRATNLFTTGYKRNVLLVPEIYGFSQKIIIILLNRSAIASDIKFYLLLAILSCSPLLFEPLLARYRLRLFHILTNFGHVCIFLTCYIYLWSLEGEEEAYQERGSKKATPAFALAVCSHFLFYLLLLLVILQRHIKVFDALGKFLRLKKD